MLRLVFVLCVVAYAGAGYRHPPYNHHHHSTETTTTEEAAPVASNNEGTFRGSWMETRRGRRFQAYRGIRYAAAPVDSLRFQPPVEIENYSDEVDATEEGPACPQPVYTEGYFVHEDCLRLNVYTPDNLSNQSLPVIVYMHAGGFYSVSGRSDLEGPSHMMDKDIVLVTINYRLASLGFLSTGDEYAPGNNGFKDQVAALRWVQRFISSFGGNPDLVTISGYSAGSFSVMLHTVSPMSQGLFHRAIAMSGSPISQMVIPEHQFYLAQRQAALMDCPTNSSKEIIDCLMNKTSTELGNSLDSMFDFGYDPVLLWMPVVEPDLGQERFLTKQPLESVRDGEMQQVPFIVSQTQDEFFWKAFSVLNNATLFETMKDEWYRIAPISFALSGNTTFQADALKVAYLNGSDIANDTATADGLGKLYADSVIGFGAHRLSNLLAHHSSEPVYCYEFAYVGNSSHYEDPVTNKPVGAAHHDDLIYLFNISYSFPSIPVSDSQDSLMVDKMSGIFFNFAKYGNPNTQDESETPELTTMSWPAFNASSQQYLRIDQEFSVHEKLYDDRYAVWEELYPIDYDTCE